MKKYSNNHHQSDCLSIHNEEKGLEQEGGLLYSLAHVVDEFFSLLYWAPHQKPPLCGTFIIILSKSAKE